ncbi:uncharacterized protein LTHEOB_6361 [Lasiodiplodia theobromae]|uniref:Uncharacterized protein n=1 Tax=Lasiodiplodia theobromae TaxID=45133 RepID=A0A5N5D146_9PEZI|nr:uncharacterized protein LTHEOB_6361 [Lasiodiplodia theobromae]KAB2571395.1 hypothetical protein DBV05_g9973 [Lasiodiplodia theobromae]KAF4544243.1 hypothetical protein LTHEOB_6361 [Lasiodiplodia theobromae]
MPDPALYTVGLITAITTEFAATCAMLDSEEEEGPDYVSTGDTNSYTLGTMGKHNVVIAGLPHGDYGTASAAAAASNMLNSFPNIRIGLMVGIGGGAPTEKHDIRLGDIVVSARDGDSSTGSVFQYDFGKAIQNQEFKTTRLLNQPPPALLTALSNLRQFYDRKGGHTLENDVESAFAGSPGIEGTHSRPESTTDWLYKSDYVHNSSCCAGSGENNDPNLVVRAPRKHGKGKSVIHYGVIASSNQLMKDARMRDKMAKEHGVLCFEMEAAGLMNHFPCLVVRGICDYSDSHKNKRWQGYAAMMAAAYTKSLLKRIAPTRIEQERKLSEIVTGG